MKKIKCKCDDCNLGYIDFGNCFKCTGNGCEKEVTEKTIDECIKVLEYASHIANESDIPGFVYAIDKLKLYKEQRKEEK